MVWAGTALARGCAVLAAVAPAAACRPPSGPATHYADPTAMISVFEDESRDAWQLPEQVIGALPIGSTRSVVAEIGAGSGYFTRRLARQVPHGRVYAIEVDREFEAYLAEHRETWGTPNIEPLLAHYDDPMLPEAGIDLVFTANTYAYIRRRTAYFEKIRASLADGGHLAVIDFRPDATPPGDDVAPAPEYRVAEDQALAELRSAGFEEVRRETFLPHQWFIILQASRSDGRPSQP